MREIKFRAWHKEQKRMLTGEFMALSLLASLDITLNHVSDLEVMQFTGLLDKNGKEIYEGDIVKADDYMPLSSASQGKTVWEKTQLIVTWNIERACWGCYSDGSGMLTANTSGFEVIGNIWEQPELVQHH